MKSNITINLDGASWMDCDAMCVGLKSVMDDYVQKWNKNNNTNIKVEGLEYEHNIDARWNSSTK